MKLISMILVLSLALMVAGCEVSQEPEKEELPQPQYLRRGLYGLNAKGVGWSNKGCEYSAVFEVGEVEQNGNLSKIKIIKGSGVDNYMLGKMKGLIPEWIKSEEIRWLNKFSWKVPTVNCSFTKEELIKATGEAK